jgi:outer membrane protein
MKKSIVAFLTLAFLCGGKMLWAQGNAPQKIGIINYFTALVECAEGKAANEDFQKKLEGKRAELQKKQAEIQGLQQQLDTQRLTLNAESQAALAKNIQNKNVELQRAQEDAEKEFNGLRQEILERIGRKMGPLVQKYAQENNFTLILDSGAQASQLVFASSTLDITQEIVKRYDTVNKPAAAPAPSAPAK